MMQPTTKGTRKAVSLKYSPTQDEAPRVTAKGQGWIAEKIIALARENGVPVKEDPDLTQVLSQVPINQEIPSSVYRVVAELLAFVYGLNEQYRNVK